MKYLSYNTPFPYTLSHIPKGCARYGVIADYHLIDVDDLREGATGHADLYIVGCFAHRTTHRLIETIRRYKGETESDHIAAVNRRIHKLVAGWRGTFALTPSVRSNVYVVRAPAPHGTPIGERIHEVRRHLIALDENVITPNPLNHLGSDLTVNVTRHFPSTGRKVTLFSCSEREAQAWCADPETSSALCVFDEALGRTAKCGTWSDHYTAR